MISSFKRFGNYIEVIGNKPTSAPTNDLVKQLELQVNNQTNPTQPRKQNRPNTTKSLWAVPPNISMPTAAVPTSATSMTYKSVAQNANQRQTAVHTAQQQPQQRQQQQQQQPQSQRDPDKIETESTKSEISGISATPTTKTMKSMVVVAVAVAVAVVVAVVVIVVQFVLLSVSDWRSVLLICMSWM